MESLRGAEADTHSQVSRGSVFGIFLALWSCVLAQPYGSLLYTWAHADRSSNLLFFFWRLNPLACAAEAIAIAWALLRAKRRGLFAPLSLAWRLPCWRRPG